MVDQRFSVSVHIMTALAFHQGQDPELMTSETLASSVRTNPTVVRRLIAKLVEAGLLKAYKGKSGGVKLAKEAQEISLKDIYVACSDKRLLSSPNKSPQKKCPVSCSMGKLMNELIDGFEENSMSYLAKIRLADLTHKISITES